MSESWQKREGMARSGGSGRFLKGSSPGRGPFNPEGSMPGCGCRVELLLKRYLETALRLHSVAVRCMLAAVQRSRMKILADMLEPFGRSRNPR